MTLWRDQNVEFGVNRRVQGVETAWAIDTGFRDSRAFVQSATFGDCLPGRRNGQSAVGQVPEETDKRMVDPLFATLCQPEPRWAVKVQHPIFTLTRTSRPDSRSCVHFGP